MPYYSLLRWLAFFYFYCFFGWCFESGYVSVKSRKWVNRGFMRGPFLPLYGSGAIMMLLVSMPFRSSLPLIYLSGCVGATVLEYVTGVVMEALFKVRYWDYSNEKFNFKGYICLGSSIAWGFLTLFMTEFLHKGVEYLVLSVPHVLLVVIVGVTSIYVISDFTLSFKAALDMRDILAKLDKVRAEMEHMQKRLDVLIAVANEEIEKRQEEKGERKLISYLQKEDLFERIEEQFLKIKDYVKKYPTAFVEEIREELMEMRGKFSIEKERRFQLKNMKDFFQRGLILGNPGMKSEKFKEALEELKEAIQDKLRNDKNG